MKRFTFILIVSLISVLAAQSRTISGTVTDEKGRPVANVNIVSDSSGAVTDETGSFNIVVGKKTKLRFSHIGYEAREIVPTSNDIVVILSQSVLKILPITVEATRAINGVTPVAFSTLTADEISSHHSVEDVPMALSAEPGIYAYSESGSGTGYSYLSIRGFDQSRIAVTIDNVPLNDNESHQVYWVDHGDLLSNAQDVQIQRGIGNSLYGASAFGGSVNVRTRIAFEDESFYLKTGFGSFATKKLSAGYRSGQRINRDLSLTMRVSQVESDGYRKFHNSFQRSAFIGMEARSGAWQHQLRANIGYENTNLVWDGVSKSELNDREARRQSYQGYTDDFLQQIYSLNSTWIPGQHIKLTNTIYLVKGAGYYEVNKTDADWYSYGLDIHNQYPDSVELALTTDLLRRKWIVNQYAGWTPTFTRITSRGRFDAGFELRLYTGDHYGEVRQFSHPELQNEFTDSWYRYYRYQGEKFTKTAFVHLVYEPLGNIYLTGDLQLQSHDWRLRQEKIGHASGHKLEAIWNFVNPRFGVVTQLTPDLSLFANVGKAQKEPADNQIISADDVWSEPVRAAAESIWDYETGLSFKRPSWNMNVNTYIIEYNNEQLKNINIEQEGEYSYYSADKTRHQGVELEAFFRLGNAFRISGNATWNQDTFVSGIHKGNYLPHFPRSLMNLNLSWHDQTREMGLRVQHAGRQYLDDGNQWNIAPWTSVNLYGQYSFSRFRIHIQVNNVFDTLYATNGYGYQWNGENYVYYWPAATRSVYGSIEYNFK